MLRLLTILSALIFSSQASAGFYTGNELYSECTARESSSTYYQSSSICSGYISGVYDHFIGTAEKGLLCIGNNVTIGQTKKIFISYADRHPEKLHLPAWLLVENSIFLAFSCKKQN